MSNKALDAVFGDDRSKGAERLVLLVLADKANDEGMCFLKRETIATEANIDKRTVDRRIETLEEAGLIYVERSGGGREKANIYWLLVPGAARHVLPERVRRLVQTAHEERARKQGQDAPVSDEPKQGQFAPFKTGASDPQTGASDPVKGDISSPPIRINPSEPFLNQCAGAREGPSPRPPFAAPSAEDAERWRAIATALGERLGQKALKDWIEKLRLVSMSPPTLAVSTSFAAETIRQRYGAAIEDAAGEPVWLIVSRDVPPSPDHPAQPEHVETPAHAAD